MRIRQLFQCVLLVQLSLVSIVSRSWVSGSLGFMMFCFVVMMHHSTNYQGYVEAVKADEP